MAELVAFNRGYFNVRHLLSDYLTKYQFEVSTGVGVTGVAGIMKNGVNSIPSNHSLKFAPALNPTLKTGLQAMMTAAVSCLN